MKGVRKIVAYLRQYILAQVGPGLALAILSFLAAAIWFNYTYNLERGILGSQRDNWRFFWWNMLYYAAPYLYGCLVIGIAGKRFSFFKSWHFWLVLFIFAFSLSFDNTYNLYHLVDAAPQTNYYLRKLASKISRIALYLIPIAVYYFAVYRGKGSFYGLTTKGFDKSPYLVMMLIMTPMLVWASFQPGFLRAYPTYKLGTAEVYWNINPIWTYIPHEILYAFTFLALEILMRGFLIFEMEKHLGERVVIPMVCVYCTLHFGKPFMECVSSIFGGFILGVIALRTRSVFGGVWIHVFIALGMNLLAFVQKAYFIKP